MGTNNIEKALTVLRGVASQDSALATKYISTERYKEHNPYAADGIDGFRQYVAQMSPENQLRVIRAFEDGDYVFTQEDGHIAGQNTFFNVFRFENDTVVEHWLFSAKAAPPNKSGHTQVDGPTEAANLEDTEKNKSYVREYYHDFHISGHHGGSERYFTGKVMVRHEPGVQDGVANFLSDVSVLMQHRTIDQIKLLLGQGDFVFIAAKGTHDGDPCAYIDLYRVEDEKIVEHWGFPEVFPTRGQAKNNNGLL